MEVSYTIQMAAKISGVGVHTIRAWEKRYKAIVPKRDLAGHRVYSKDDIEKLILLSELCLMGFAISKIASSGVENLKEQLSILGKSSESIKSLEMNLYSTEELKVDHNQSVTIILMALKSYKLDIVSKELSRLKIVMNSRDFALEVILPIMSELGAAVVNGDYTISHEHALSAILKFHIGHLIYKNHENFDREYYTIVICGIEQDHHEFGILVAALLALHHQFNIVYLGPNLPAESLSDAVAFLDAKLIVIGVTSVVKTMGNNYIQNYVEKVFDKTSTDINIAIGSPISFELGQKYKKRVKHFSSLEVFDQFLAKLM